MEPRDPWSDTTLVIRMVRSPITVGWEQKAGARLPYSCQETQRKAANASETLLHCFAPEFASMGKESKMLHPLPSPASPLLQQGVCGKQSMDAASGGSWGR